MVSASSVFEGRRRSRARISPSIGREPIRVAHVTTSDFTLRLLLLNQLRTLGSQGYEIYGISAAGPDVPALRAAGVEHIAIPTSRRFDPLGDLRALFHLWRAMRREQFSIVHTHTPKAGLLGQYAALLAGVPLRMHTIHGLYFPGQMHPRTRFAYVLLERITMAFSHRNFCQSPEDMPVAIGEKICPPERLELIGNGIDIRAFDPALQPREKRSSTRKSLGLAEDDLVVGVVARLVAEKGYREMFRVVEMLRERERRARFIFVGGFDPSKSDAIPLDTLACLGIDDVAQFLGYRLDVPDLYAIMDVHVLPSHREGFPRAPMEASAMGIPSVVTNIRGCRQTVEDGVTGRIVPARNPDALADAIQELLLDPEKRRSFGAAARAKALKEFDEQAVFQRIMAAYERLLNEVSSEAAPCTPKRG
jgi:glycosyltransferase involved in cell wall biosynthesis